MVQIKHVKDGGWSWMVVCASFIINFLMDGVRYSFSLLYIEFLNNFEASKGAVGLIGGIMFGLLLIAAPISGSLVNKFGCRIITISGSCLASLGFFCSSFVTGIGFLYITLGVLGGVGFSMLFMSMYVAIIQRFEKYRSLAIGLAVSGSGLGGFAFSPLTNLLLEQYSWRGTLMILSAILLNGFICGAVMRPVPADAMDETDYAAADDNTELSKMLGNVDQESGMTITNETDSTELYENGIKHVQRGITTIDERLPMQKEQLNTTDCNVSDVMTGITQRLSDNKGDEPVDDNFVNVNRDLVETETESLHRNRQFMTRLTSFLLKIFRFSLLINKLFLLFVFVEIFINISYMVPFMYGPDLARVMFKDSVSREEIVWLPNAMSIANVVSRIPIGVLADLKIISNVKLVGILSVLAGISCVVMPFCSTYGLLVAACVCYSACIVSAMVLIPVVLAELFGDDVIADSFGLCLFFGGVSGLVGTPMAGWLFDLTGTYDLTFIMAGVEFALGGLVLFILSKYQVYKENNISSTSFTRPDAVTL